MQLEFGRRRRRLCFLVQGESENFERNVIERPVQSCVKISLLSLETRPQIVQQPTQTMRYGTIFLPAILQNLAGVFYTTL